MIETLPFNFLLLLESNTLLLKCFCSRLVKKETACNLSISEITQYFIRHRAKARELKS